MKSIIIIRNPHSIIPIQFVKRIFYNLINSIITIQPHIIEGLILDSGQMNSKAH